MLVIEYSPQPNSMISPDEAAVTVVLISAPEERLIVLALTVII